LGSRIVGLTLPDVMRLRLSLAGGVLYDTLPEWGPVMRKGLKEKMVALSDPGIRRMLRDGASKATFNRRWADWTATTVTDVGDPKRASLVGRTIGAIAEASRADPFDTFLDLAIADNLATGFQPPAAGDDEASWKMRSEYWRDDRIVIGGSDAGAHLDQVATYNCYSTFVGPVVRDRQLISLAEAVHLSTDVPARLVGLDRRGRIAEGWYSDLMIFDPATVGPTAIEGRYDLPAGAFRLYGAATGIERVMVNGETVVEAGEYTDARPGRILRSGTDTKTVAE
jgi:N-acyl-D-aspartate/D-glutamate deacylase